MQAINNFYTELGNTATVVVTMHQKPDPDAMGSSLALAGFLQKLGHSVTVISPTNWPQWLNWMPGCNKVLDYELYTTEATDAINKAQIIFCLDFNTLSRTKLMEPLLRAFTGTKILIDHHREPETAVFKYGISNTAKSSTCEMVYDFIIDSGNELLLDDNISQCIYAGIIADTGSFRFDSTSGDTHKAVAHLKSKGLNHSKVHENLFDNFMENKLRFVGHVLQNRMEFYYEYNTALIAIPKNDLFKFHIKTGETDGLVNYPLSIQGIKLVGLVIDRDEERKWSFRSKGDFDCNSFARKYFNGGGHFNAAGGHSKDSLDETVKKFLQAMKENEAVLSPEA